jgi:guanylate kinase
MDLLQTAIAGYTPEANVKQILKDVQLVLLVGPTGSGKNTLEQELLKTGQFRPLVTHTTRAPRENHGVMEVDGDEYHFISTEEALSMLKNQEFVEAAYTHTNMYGTSIEELSLAARESKIAVADLDVKGVRAYCQLMENLTPIFLLPPSFKILIERLTNRYGELHEREDIKIRLATAIDELSELLDSDYYHIIVNEDKSISLGKVLEVVNGSTYYLNNDQNRQVASQLIDKIKDYLKD